MKTTLLMMAIFAPMALFAQNTDADDNTDNGVSGNYNETHVLSGFGEDHYNMPGYNGTIGCAWPMEEIAFGEALNSVVANEMEDGKLSTAKQVTQNNCLTTEQVRELMDALEFEESKLEFAKLAFYRTFDQDNYSKLNDGFEFDASMEELNEHISR